MATTKKKSAWEEAQDFGRSLLGSIKSKLSVPSVQRPSVSNLQSVNTFNTPQTSNRVPLTLPSQKISSPAQMMSIPSQRVSIASPTLRVQTPTYSTVDYSKFSQNADALRKQQREKEWANYEAQNRKIRMQEAFWKPLATVQDVIENKLTKLPKATFADRAIENQKTLIGKLAVGVPLGLVQGVINFPAMYAGGIAKTGTTIGKGLRGEPIRAQDILSGGAETGEAILNASIVGGLLKSLVKTGGKELVKQTAKTGIKQLAPEAPSFLKTVWGGTKIGAKYGGTYAFLSGLQDTSDAPTVQKQVMDSLGYVPAGIVLGGATGGVLSGTTYVVSKTMTKVLNTPTVRRMLFNPGESSKVYRPADFLAQAEKTGNKEVIAQAEIIAETARKTGSDINLEGISINPNWVGRKLTGAQPWAGFRISFVPPAQVINAEVPATQLAQVQTPGLNLGGVVPNAPINPLGGLTGQIPGQIGGVAPAYAPAFRTEAPVAPQATPTTPAVAGVTTSAPTPPTPVPVPTPTQPQPVAGPVPSYQVGITSAQQASPITAQTLEEGNGLFTAGNVDEGLAKLREVTESTKGQLEGILKNNGVEIERLETGAHGLYFGTPEPTFWLQVKMPDLTQGLGAIAEFGKIHGQESFITATKVPETQVGATPGMEVDFGKPLTNQEFLQIQKIVNDAGLGLTLNQNTGEGVVYNIKDFDSLEPEGFTQSALGVAKALQDSGLNFTSDLDFFDTKVYYNKDYDNLINAANQRKATLGGGLPTGVEGLGGVQAVETTAGKYPSGVPTENAITSVTGETTYRGTEGVTPAYTSQPAVYNVPADRAEKLFRELFSPDEVKFLLREEGKLFNEKGQLATGKYADSLVEVVEKAGKVQDKTIYHEAFHAYASKFANPALYQEAFNETKQKYHFKENASVNEKLADDFADWYAGKKTFSGRILAFFQQVLDWVKSFITKRSAISSLFQEAAAKKRYIRPEDTVASYQEITAPNSGGIVQKNLTTKLLQTVVSQGGDSPSRVVDSQYILNLTNNPGLKQAERDLVRSVVGRLTGEDGKVNVSEFVNAVRKELMPLQAGETNSWENIVLPDELRGDVSDYKARIYEAPFETKAGTTHFRGEDFPRYLAHVRTEDMADGSLVTDEVTPYGRHEGGTRRIIEIQSDLFQRGRFEEEFPTAVNRLKAIDSELADWNRQKEYATEAVQKYQQFIDAIKSGVLEKEGFITPEFDAMKGGTAFWDNFKDWKPTPAQKKLMEKKGMRWSTGDLGFKDYLEAKYGIEHSMWNYLPDYGSKELLLQDMGYKLDREKQVLAKHGENVSRLSAEKKQLQDNPPELTNEEQQKMKWLTAYRNNWFERILKEEIAKAAQDKKGKLQIPTGETIARIEGYVDSSPVPTDAVQGDEFDYGGNNYLIVSDNGDYVDAVDDTAVTNRFDYEQAVDEEIENQYVDTWDYELRQITDGRTNYVPFDLDQMISRAINANDYKQYKENPIKFLTDPANKFKVDDLSSKVRDEIERDVRGKYKDADDFAEQWTQETGLPYYHIGNDTIVVLDEGAYTENFRKGSMLDEFDTEQLSEDQLRVYDFYQKDIQKFLKKIRPDLKEVKDERGITWFETAITPKDLKQPIEAFRTEKGAVVKPSSKVAAGARPMETMDDFRDAMKKLGVFRNYNVEAVKPPEPPAKTDEELAMEALNRYRGYKPVPPETMEKLPPDTKERVEQLDDMQSDFIEQIGQIDDVLRNYDFYTKRFGKLMPKTELKNLQKELSRFAKEAQEQIWELGKQTVTVEKPVPTDEELALKGLETYRAAQAAQMAPPAEQAPIQPIQEALAPEAGNPPPAETLPTTPQKALDPFGKDVQTNVSQALRNKGKVDGTPPQITGDTLSDFKTIFSQMIGEHEVAQTVGTEVAEKFTNIPWDKGMDVIMAREAGGSTDPQIDSWAREIGESYDELYNLAANTPGIDLGYWENYITHIWDKPMNEVANDYRNFKLRFRFENEREIPTYEEGLKMGLKPRYTHPAQIIAYYTTTLYKAMANIKAFKALQDAGIIVPASEGARIPGYVPVDAPGVKRSVGYTKMGKKTAMVMGNFYAPKDIADTLNRVFSPPATTGLGKVFAITAPISSVIQDLRLSGGVPFTPLNAWTFGQLIREMTTAVGGFPLYPIASAEKAVDGLTSTLVSIFPKASVNFFRKNVGQIKKMQARDIPMQTTYTIDNLLGKDGTKRLFGDGVKSGLGKIWKKAIFEATFRRFMPMQMIKMFNHIEAAALRAGKTPAQAGDIAAEAVKKYHGVITSTEMAMRSKATQDALTTFLFAPHYRQTMWRAWKNAALATFPFKVKNGKVQFNNPFSMENRSSVSFLVGTILTVIAWNLANLAINGKSMSENPPGTEDKLLIPLDDGTTLGVPFLPSVATLPRAAYRVAGRLMEADMPGIAREGRSFLSMGLVPWLDVAYNSDYYGRDIYNDNDTKDERFKKIAAYIGKQYQHPWIEAAVNQMTGKYPTYQNVATAIEAPLRFYNANSLNARYYYDNLREQRATLTPEEQKIWDSMHKNIVFDQDDGLPVYDKRSAMANALNRLAYPNIIRAETEAAVKTAQEQGVPINPFYLLSPDQQFVALQLKSFYPGEETYKTIRDQNKEWLQPYWDAVETWKNEMVKRGIFEAPKDDEITKAKKEAVYALYMQGTFDAQEITDALNNATTKTGATMPKFTKDEVGRYIAEMPYPEPSPELQTKLDYYNTLPYGTGARSRYLRANPDVLQYFDIVKQRTNDSRLDLGLPITDSGSYSGWGSYQKKPSLKKLSVGKFPQLKLSGPTSSSVSLKLKPLTTGVKPLKMGTRTAERYAVPMVSIKLRNMPQTLSGLGR